MACTWYVLKAVFCQNIGLKSNVKTQLLMIWKPETRNARSPSAESQSVGLAGGREGGTRRERKGSQENKGVVGKCRKTKPAWTWVGSRGVEIERQGEREELRESERDKSERREREGLRLLTDVCFLVS